tara:strand:- start:1186 stop:1527 length:342 start_codon:yes stop_codon:yes gene_type:complete
MDIEPLKSILDFSTNKKETLLYYFPTDVKKRVINMDYESKNFYRGEYLCCVKRNTFEIDTCGKLIINEKGRLGIKMTSVKNVYINPNDYYIFVRHKKSVNLERDFLKGLLKNL